MLHRNRPSFSLKALGTDKLRQKDVNFQGVDYIAPYGYVETEPKTKRSRRKILLPGFVLKMLKDHKLAQLEEHRLEVGDAWQGLDLVVCGLDGGYLNPRYILKMFDQLLDEVDIPHMHFHDLRHSVATILASMGINMKVIQEMLGHSDISITLGLYSHLMPSMQQEVIEKWEDVFGDEEVE